MVSLLYHVSAADQLGSTMQSAVQKSFPRFIRLVRGPSQCPISSVVKLTGANLCPGVPSVDKISSASPRSLSSSPLRRPDGNLPVGCGIRANGGSVLDALTVFSVPSHEWGAEEEKLRLHYSIPTR
ncbi:hypothetical protein VTN49DRAFT_8058 [Thermomyces lanuginosus]|uniref:uncharacterized protein n=1 Tax=Thermomyces lanuginosus TaxID=5541 RepID=UPI0037424B48